MTLLITQLFYTYLKLLKLIIHFKDLLNYREFKGSPLA